MVSIASKLTAFEIENRAAQVRASWSPAERLRRTGLPPDVPERLRDFFFAPCELSLAKLNPKKKM